MIVYRDIISGDEMLSDAFKLIQVTEDGVAIDGLMYCESKNISKNDDVDVGCGNAFGGGGEEDGGGVDSTVQTVNNVIDGFQYNEMPFSSASEFKGFLKDYFNRIREKLAEKHGKGTDPVKAFMARAPEIAKYLVKRFSDVQTYVGASFNPDSMVFSIYPEGATTPNFYYIMDGFIAEKF